MVRNLSMQQKLVGALGLLSIVALVSIGWFATRSVVERRADAATAAAARDVADLGSVTGALIHELQVERGYTVGFVNSQGANFAGELRTQRARADEAHAALRDYVEDHGDAISDAAISPIRRALERLSGIDGLRGQADGFTIAGGDAAAFYTGTIAQMIDGLEQGFSGVDQAELARDGRAFLSLAKAKEAAGQQRAHGTAVFTADAFTPATLELVTSLLGQQQGFLDEFEASVDEQLADTYRQMVSSDAFRRVAELEQVLFDRAAEGGFGVDPSVWFDATTARIELMREVEQTLTDHLVEDAAAAATAAGRSALVDTVLAVLAIGLLLGIGITLTVWVRRRVVAPLTDSARALASSSQDMSAVSTQVGSNAEETAAQAGVVASAGEQVSQNVQAVAAAVEQLTSSISEIAQNASTATEVANEAVGAAHDTRGTISQLGESSAEIGQVIELINTIAEQTNLLSLNATIEAARAGEAGKGFAVVAHEVKELAKETASATEEVSRRITAIQDDSGRAVTAIQQISEIAERIADLQTTIASAVEEQSSATGEIARSVNEAAQGASEIAENISSVATAAQDTTEGAARTQAAATELSRMAATLDTLVFGEGARGNQPSGGPSGNGGVQLPVQSSTPTPERYEPAEDRELVHSR